MTQPSYAQLRSLQTSAASVVSETIQERILTVLSMIASGQNPDGSVFNLVQAGESAIALVIEGNYNDGSGSNKMEIYIQALTNDGTAIRPMIYTVDRTKTAGQNGLIPSVNFLGYPFNFQTPANAGTATFICQIGGSSQAFIVNPDGAPAGGKVLISSDGRLLVNPSGTGKDFTTTDASLLINSRDTLGAVPVIVVNALAGQTGDLFKLIDSNSVTLHRFNKAGYSITKKTSAPADGDLNASELAMYFTDTNGAGAARVNFKGKQADGTVVTAAVVMA